MRISEKPTEYILVKAHTNSEWDSCDCALVNIGTIADIHSRWRNLNVEAGALQSSYPGFLTIEVLTSTVQFFDLTGVDDKWEELTITEQLPKKGWSFVEIEQDDEHINHTPTQQIALHTMKLYGEDRIGWTGTGKNTGEEFFTDTISLADIINAINSYQ